MRENKEIMSITKRENVSLSYKEKKEHSLNLR